MKNRMIAVVIGKTMKRILCKVELPSGDNTTMFVRQPCPMPGAYIAKVCFSEIASEMTTENDAVPSNFSLFSSSISTEEVPRRIWTFSLGLKFFQSAAQCFRGSMLLKWQFLTMLRC